MSTQEEDILVNVEGLSKKFSTNLKLSLWYGLIDVLRLLFRIKVEKNQLRNKEFWAVKNISFQLRRGECLGLIGHNGAGKSTLLKILNGLINPDEGMVELKGRVGALIELNAGFNPTLTGRENIFINGQILGFTKKEIEAKLDDIIEFSELDSFIDSPVQNYSSGMKVRLGFAIAAQMEPDILIIDEVLAVGDLGFRLKCFDAMDQLMKNTAIIFVSHSMPMVSRMCTDILLMNKGEKEYYGKDVSKGIDLYYAKFTGKEGVVFKGDQNAELNHISIETSDEVEGLPAVNWHEDLKILLEYSVSKNHKNCKLLFNFFDIEQRPIGVCINENVIDSSSIIQENGEVIRYRTKVILRNIELSKGAYTINLSIAENETKRLLVRYNNVLRFLIKHDKKIWQPLLFAGEWHTE